jgi:hypothetical protein
MDIEDHMIFIHDFIIIIRYLTDGNTSIGFSRRDDMKGKIHRKSDDDIDQEVPLQILEPNKESE